MKKALLLLLFGVTIGWHKIQAQDEMFKALFMYNFTKDIEWPPSHRTGEFVIQVVGSSPIVDELQKIASAKKVGSQPIVVKKINSASEITKCNMLVITPGKSTELTTILKAVAGQPILIVSDKEGLAKAGSCINLIKIDGKQKFEINTKAIAAQGLKVTSFLTSLGIAVQ